MRRLALAAALLSVACAPKSEPALDEAAVQSRLLEGKRHLSRFEGEQAREVFLALDEAHREALGEPSCEARYGVVLADIQVALGAANPALVAILEEQFRPAAAGAPPADAAIEAAAAAAEPALRELVEYAAEVTRAGCTFSIGVDAAEAEASLAFVMNVLDAERPVAQVVLQNRFDGVEARVIGAVVNAVLAALDLALAHDLNWVAEPAKVARQLGVTEACLQDGYIPCYLSGQAPGHPPAHLLDWAFVLADNPKLGAASPRWGERMPRVAIEGAAALLPLRDVFEAMLARSTRIYRSDTVRDDDFLIVYRDRDGNDRVNTADELGLNVAALALDCAVLVGLVVAEEDAEACARAFDEYETIAETALVFVKSAASPSERVVDELDRFFERLYAQLAAVASGAEAEAIPFDSLTGLFSEMFPVLDEEAPNFVAFDVAPYFRDPAPARALLPAWEKTAGPTGARFLADADDYAALATPPATVNAVDAYLDEAHGPLLYNLFGAGHPEVFDPVGVTERGLFACLPGEPCIPSDCLNASNLWTDLPGVNPIDGAGGRRWRWPAIYLWLPDPTLAGTIEIDGGVWAVDPALGNGACPAAGGFAPPDNHALQRSAWLFADFFMDHFTLSALVANFLAE